MSRNIVEFPVTADEVIRAIDSSIHNLEGLIGGNDGYCLWGIKEFLIANPPALATIVNRLDIRPKPVVVHSQLLEASAATDPQLWNWS